MHTMGGGGNSYIKPKGTHYGLFTFVYTMANTNTLSRHDTDFDISKRKRKRSSKKAKSYFCHHCDKVVSLSIFFRFYLVETFSLTDLFGHSLSGNCKNNGPQNQLVSCSLEALTPRVT